MVRTIIIIIREQRLINTYKNPLSKDAVEYLEYFVKLKAVGICLS